MQIRQATNDDTEAIGRLWLELVRYHQPLDDAMPVPTEDGSHRYASRILDQILDQNSQVLVADDDAEIVGYVVGIITDMMPEMFEAETGGFLADIFVAESHRHAGIGDMLVEALVRWFRGRDVQYIEWFVTDANISAMAFWQRVGGRSIMRRMRLDLNDYLKQRSAR